MTTCHACGGQINGSDRFCRNCGAPIAALVGDLVETQPFSSTETSSQKTSDKSSDTGDRFQVAPGGVQRPGAAAPPPYQTGSFLKQPLEHRRNWILIVPVVVLLFALLVGAGVTVGRVLHKIAQRQTAREGDHRKRVPPTDTEDGDNQDASDQDANDNDADGGRAEEALQNGLGFVPSEVSDEEYPDIEGVFVGRLTSDTSPAALAHIQAGDVLTQFGETPVSDSGDIADAMSSLQPGAEVAVKLYRDGETISTRIKIADPAHAPFGQSVATIDQGFLGLGDVERRCCIQGTKKYGLEIDRVIDNSPADLAGLQKGDVITEFEKHPVKTPAELTRRIRAATPRSRVVIKFYRGATEQTAEVLMGHGSAEEDDSNKEQ
jgi:membrane-associated protease RseP (regulator of RpoE activity)